MSDCDKVLLACKRHDHPLQRKYTFMKKQNLNPFDLNRTEYAELLGITPNAVRMRMRHGRLEGQYKFENRKYFFKAPERVRENQGVPGGQMTTLKKIYRRGNHYKANYPNEAFRKHNEAKMLAKLKYNVDQEVQDLMPEAIEIAQKKKRERIMEAQKSLVKAPTTNKYGSGIFNESNKGYDDPQYHNGRAHEYHSNKFTATNRGRKKPWKNPYW